jgi:hypothetical protein
MTKVDHFAAAVTEALQPGKHRRVRPFIERFDRFVVPFYCFLIFMFGVGVGLVTR